MTTLFDFAQPASRPRRAADGERARRHRAGDHSLCGPDRARHGTCAECGKTIQVSSSSTVPERRRCQECRRARPKTPDPRICDLCEESYVPKPAHRPDQRWCSKSCKTAWQNGARPPYYGKLTTREARRTALARTRRLRHAQTWDGIADEEILDRDGWRCQIPGCKRRPIRKDLKYPHPRSKSVDHIIPLSLGGDDTAENKRAAHFGCNIARSNKAGDEQVALFGVIREAPLATLTAGERAARRKRRTCPCGAAPLQGAVFCQDCRQKQRDAKTEERRQQQEAEAQERRVKAESRAVLHAEIRKLLAQGFTTRAVAEHLNTSPRMVVRVSLADPVTGKLPR